MPVIGELQVASGRRMEWVKAAWRRGRERRGEGEREPSGGEREGKGLRKRGKGRGCANGSFCNGERDLFVVLLACD